MVERKAFPANPKHQDRVSQCGEHGCRANNKKNGVIVIKRKAFLAKPNHQCHVSKWEEHGCCAHNKSNWDYYEYSSLSHFMDEH